MAGKTGVNFLLYVDTSTTGASVYTKVAGQRGATLNRSNDTVETTSKDSAGFKEYEYGFGDWSIDFDGLLVEDDAAFLKLEDVFLNKKKVLVRFQTAAGNKYEGTCLLTDWPVEAPYDGESTYKGTLQGSGAYTKVASV